LHTLPLALRIVVRRARSLIAVTIAVSVALALALAMLLIAMSRAIFSLMLEDCEIAGTDL